MKHFFRLVRLPNLCIIALTLFLLRYQSIVTPHTPILDFIIIVIGTTLIAAAGNIINDILDIEIDTINKPEAVIVGKSIPLSIAWNLYWSFNVIALLIGIFCYATGILLFFIPAIILLFLYSKYWKQQPFIGNLTIALLCAWVVVEFGWLEQTQLSPYWFYVVLSYSGFAFLATLIRELVKDLEDEPGDRAIGCQTLPIVVGTRWTKVIIYGTFGALFIILLLEGQLFYQYQNWLALTYTILSLSCTLAYLFYKAIQSQSTQHYHQLSQYLKFYMLLGLLLLLLA